MLNTSRTLFQERAPAAERARTLAVNQLGFTAVGPLGALLSGFAAAQLGPADALAVFGLGMLALVAIVSLATGVARTPAAGTEASVPRSRPSRSGWSRPPR